MTCRVKTPSNPDPPDLPMNRRHFLRAAGLSLALPTLRSAAGAASPTAVPHAVPLTTAAGDPLRMAFLYVPNGVNVTHWTPTGEGADWAAGKTLSTLDDVRQHFSVVSGLEHRPAYQHRDGAGDHARANATFLTGAHVRKTAGYDIHVGQSVDQRIAENVGGLTRLSSLELSCDGSRRSGGCDSGYACAYQYNLSWKDASTPAAPECDPRLVFERLFGHGPNGQRQANFRERMARQKSMLDFLRDQTRSLNAGLSTVDRRRLEEYLTGVRELEQRIESAERMGPPVDPSVPTPAGIPDSFGAHIDLMFDVLALAFETDTTRVATFMLAHDGSNRSFEEIGITDAHHDLSHHGRREDRLAKLQQIDEFYLARLRRFLQKLSETPDGEGRTLLDNSAIVYGSGLSDGDRHSHRELPVLLAGRGGGLWTPGRHVKLKTDTPMSNLYLSMLHAAGVADERFGDSEGPLGGV